MSENAQGKLSGLWEIVTRFPSVSFEPVARGRYALGLLLIAIVGIIFRNGLSSLLGEWVTVLVVGVAFSYIAATWMTKRFVDIWGATKARTVRALLFVGSVSLNLILAAQSQFLYEHRAWVEFVAEYGLEASGAPEVSQMAQTYLMPVSTARTVLGIPFLILGLILLFKKGTDRSGERAAESQRQVRAPVPKVEISIKKGVLTKVLLGVLIIIAALLTFKMLMVNRAEVYDHNLEVMEKCREMYGKGNAANECIKTLKK